MLPRAGAGRVSPHICLGYLRDHEIDVRLTGVVQGLWLLRVCVLPFLVHVPLVWVLTVYEGCAILSHVGVRVIPLHAIGAIVGALAKASGKTAECLWLLLLLLSLLRIRCVVLDCVGVGVIGIAGGCGFAIG